MGIQRKLTFLMITLILLGIALTSLFTLRTFSGHIRDNTIADLQERSQALKEQVDALLADQTKMLRFIAESEGLQKALENNNVPDAVNRLANFKMCLDIACLELLLPGGEIAHLPGTPEAFFSGPADSILSKALNGENLRFFFYREGRQIIRLVQPVFSKNSSAAIAVLVSGFVMDKHFLDNLKMKTGAEIIFIDPVGRMQTTLAGERADRLHTGIMERLSRRLNSGNSNVFNVAFEANGRDYLFCFFPFQYVSESSSGYFASGVSLGFMQKAQNQVLLQILIISLIATLIVGIVAWFVSRTISRPIGRLKQSAYAMAQGKLKQTIPKESNDEIGELTDLFNEMAASLNAMRGNLEAQVKARTAELHDVNLKLKKYTDNLERMVAKRTAELRTKDAALLQSAKLASLGEMATGIAHEVNQPISVIKIIVTGLMRQYKQQGKLDSAVIHNELMTINQQTVRLQKIISHMRMFARKRTGTQFSPTDVNRIIKDSFLLVGQQLRAHNIDIDLQLDDRLPEINADQTLLEQVIINLINNARDALDEKALRLTGKERDSYQKSIAIRTFKKDKFVVIEVTDNGAGIAPDIAGQVFEPFFTTKAAPKGTGLGLSISYNLVKTLFGEIEIKSAPDQGAAFVLTFPVHQEIPDGTST